MADGDDFQVVPLTRVVSVEGSTGRGDQGHFSGVVIALGWWPVGAAPGGRNAPAARVPAMQRPATPEMLYLVSDMTKPAPLWVKASEITRQYHGGTGVA
jgi:hypothetical protein